MKNILSVLLIVLHGATQACICEELSFLTLQECGKYDWIAYGVVGEVETCPEGIVSFDPLKIYKGKYSKRVEVELNCDIDCVPDVNTGETWLFYAEKDNAQNLRVGFCGHSRKQLPDSIQDFQSEFNGRTFKGELQFLEENFEVARKVRGINLEQRKYEKVDPKLVPYLIGIGLLFMLIGYFVFNKIVEKNR